MYAHKLVRWEHGWQCEVCLCSWKLQPRKLCLGFPWRPIDQRAAAIQWARESLRRTDVVILDTETTGLGGDAQIIELAVIAMNGSILLNTLMRPTVPIEPEASRVHKITWEQLAQAPSLIALESYLRKLFHNRTVLAYNAPFDRRLLAQTCAAQRIPRIVARDWEDICAAYTHFISPGGGKHTRLNGGHRALDDCQAALRRIQKMAAADF
ncbi:MAG: 3'-5' exonuclease [Candidatus Viridilinea halotolerans]|uniref:3'-5' exonuclease n=1 Tax=Candidatus Viridilinea halotolerans TaxID=2491704 RepID=A0A426U2W4_9CHLR|nr:MAG: 3'-5' exonuclease [Candidatus Viridilinea halotolerans]